MKLKKALRGYYRDQVGAVSVQRGIPVRKAGRGGSRFLPFNALFHAAVIGVIVSAMISGYYRTSLLERRIGELVDRYNIEERMTNSLDDLIIIIKNNRKAGGDL